MLGNTDAVAVGDFSDDDFSLDGGLQIDVIRSDTGGDRQLELGRLGDALRGQVRRPKRLRDHDLRIWQLSLEDRIRAVLVGGDDQLMAL